MFQFFKRKSGKVDGNNTQSVARTPNAKSNETRKDVVNLLIPHTDYSKNTANFFNIMAGKRRRGRKKRSESCASLTPPKETNIVQPVQRSESISACDVATENNLTSRTESDPAECVKAIVLQKYAKPDNHVSLIYVTPDLDEKRHTEALLREIARSIDCTVDKLNDEMGGADSKPDPVYHTIDSGSNSTIDSYKNDLKDELNKLITEDSPSSVKKSNLKLPKSDTEGCSDDDRSDNGKKRVTFRKHIIFDDGEQQTDEEVESSFESLSSEEEEEEYLEDALDNKTVIEVNEPVTIRIDDTTLEETSLDNKTLENKNRTLEEYKLSVEEDKRIFSDNSDSGYIENDRNNSGDELNTVKSEESESDSETEEIIEEIIEEEIEFEEVEEEIEEEEEPEDKESSKSLVNHGPEGKFRNQVESRTEDAERTRDLIAAARKEIEAKDQEIEHLKCELASAYKESELIRQRSRSLEEELSAARSCSADLADQLQRRNEEFMRELRGELEDSLARRAELESRVLVLERDRDRLELEKKSSEQRALEALSAAEATTAKWRSAHEAARSQAAARAERMLADCEWKMRELEKRARDAEGKNKQLTDTVEKLQSAPPTPSHIAELQQLRGMATEQQRSVQSLTLQLQRLETREEALKLEVHRLKELLHREEERGREKEHTHLQKIQSLQETHSKTVETLKSDHASSLATTRSAIERSHAERTRAALAQLRGEADQAARNAERKLREVSTKFENLKEVLASKETQFAAAIAEARSKADWDILQLRHLLDKADIDYANNVDNLTLRYETDKERLIEEWTEKLKEVELQAATDATDAKKLLETTRLKLVAEKLEQINKLKDQHRREMDDQWEQFMTDKENCLQRMKSECRQEGDEERVKREKELLEEIAELKSQVNSKSSDFDNLAVKAAACGRTLAVTEQELREALAREKELREKRSDDATKIKQVERSSRDQIDHLTRKCACLRKLFDDIRARLATKERAAEQENRARDKELHHLRGEVARLTKILVEQSSPKLGARTRADGCEMIIQDEAKTRKGGSLRAHEVVRKRTAPLPELSDVIKDGRPRAKSVDLPAVQVPVRIRQLEGRRD